MFEPTCIALAARSTTFLPAPLRLAVPNTGRRSTSWRRTSTCPPPALRSRRADVPEGLAAVVHRLLAKDPADRPATAAEVAAALEGHAQGCDLAALATAAREKAKARVRGETWRPDEVTLAETSDLRPAAAARPAPIRPASPSPPRRRRPRWFLGSAAGLVVGVAALAVVGVWPRGEPTSPEEHHSGEMTPLVWYPLLDRSPTELLWSRERGDSRWSLNPNQHELWVRYHADRGLLRVGEARRVGYTLQVDINQDGWTGGIGVFFGYGEDFFQGAPCVRYQFVELRPFLPNDPNREFALCRGVDYVVSNGKPGADHHVRDLASAPIPRPGGHDQLLELEVEARGLVSVRWAGQPLARLTAPTVNATLEEANYVGQFGTVNDASAGVFRNYRIMLFERNR